MEDRQNIVANQIEGYTTALTEARTRRIALSARVRELRAAASRDPLAVNVDMVDTNTEVLGLRTTYREKLAERAALVSRYGDNHPQMRSLTEEITNLETNMRRVIEGILRRADADLREVERIESGLRGALDQSHGEGIELNLQEIAYDRLSRERENNEKLYNMLLERTAEANLARLLRVTHVRLVYPALMPGGAVRPRVLMNMMGGLGALALGILLALAAGLMDRTIKSASDIEALGVTVLGFLPMTAESLGRSSKRGRKRRARAGDTSTVAAATPELYVHEHPRSVVAECCRTIRTNLAFMGAADAINDDGRDERGTVGRQDDDLAQRRNRDRAGRHQDHHRGHGHASSEAPQGPRHLPRSRYHFGAHR